MRDPGKIAFNIDEADVYRCIDLFLKIREAGLTTQITSHLVQRLRHDINLQSYVPLGVPDMSRLSEIEKMLKVRLKIWTNRRIRIAGVLKRVIVPFREPFEEGQMVDNEPIVNLYGNDLTYKTYSTKNLSLIFDEKAYFDSKIVRNSRPESTRLKRTLFQAVVSEKFPELGGHKFDDKVKQFEEKWGKTTFEVCEIGKFQDLFKIGLQIWSFDYVHEDDRARKYSVLKFESRMSKKVAIELEDFDEFEMIPTKICLTYIPDTGQVNYFRCKTKNCLYGTSRKFNYDRHIATCRSDTTMTCKQIAIGADEKNARQALVNEGILPTENFENFFYAVYDVESLMKKSVEFWESGAQVHRLASIAVLSNLDREEEVFLYRRDMKPDSLALLVKEFWAYLTEVKKKMFKLLPSSVIEGYTHYCQFLKSEEFKKMTPGQKNFAKKKMKILGRIRTLKCYSWNGERYDSNVLIAPLMELFSQDAKKFTKLSTIKRKSGYMQITFDGISLLGKSLKMMRKIFSITNEFIN